MAAFSVAAFVLCFALAGTTNIAAGFTDKKAYTKGYRALRKGDFQEAETILVDAATGGGLQFVHVGPRIDVPQTV